jgi:hypothetical protein
MPSTHYLAKQLIQHVLCGPGTSTPATPYTQPSTTYLALYTAAPSQDGVNPGTEVSGAGTAYQRQQVSFGNIAGNTSSNLNDIKFDVASQSWGDIRYWGLFDAAFGGNLLFIGTIDNPRTISQGDEASFDRGSLVVICS